MSKLSKTIKFDKTTGEFVRPTLLLEHRNGKRIGKINYDNLSISFSANKIDEISFDVHKYINGQKNKQWDKLCGLKIINYKDYGLFQADFTINETNETIKTCVAQSLEIELCNRIIRDFHVNDEEDVTIIDTNENFIPTVFYNESDPKHSLLHRILSEKAPHWSIGTVPELLNVSGTIYQPSQIQRTFTIDSESIYDFLTGEVSKEFNVVFLFDTYNRQINCYNAEECIYNKNTLEVVYGGYELEGQYYAYDENGTLIQLPQADYSSLDSVGKDTHILVTTNKLSQSFQLDENSDAVKNTFYISGGDDVITNFAAQANVTGKNYITIFSKMQCDDMSENLVQLIKQYNQLLESKESTFNATGGVYLQNSNYIYNGYTAYNDTTKEITTDFRLDNKNNVYILDSCAYTNNGKVYSRDDILLTSGYIVDNTEGLFTKYCHLNDRYYYLNNSKFPLTTLADTTAMEQYQKLSQHFSNTSNRVLVYNSCDTTSFQSVQNTVETMLEVVCDSRYTIKLLSSKDSTSNNPYSNPSLSNDINDNTTTATWTATVRLTRETKPTDTYEGQLSVHVQKTILDDIDTNNAYCKQKMDIAISKMSIADLDFTNYHTEKQLISFFHQYNLTTLKSFKDAFSNCLSTLEDAYSNSMAADIKTSSSSSYTELHDQYLLRQTVCEKVYKERKEQVRHVQFQINACLSSIEKLRQDIDMESYFKDPQNGGSEELWLEYNMYIREDEYNNSNYISDGLSDAEILAKAKELLEAAKKELKRACVAQKTISGSLNNIFTQRQLEQLHDDFSLYNYIRCRVDDRYYKLRLLEVELHESNLAEIQCTFAENVEDVTGTVENIKSVLEQASSMSSSYSSTVKQSKQGASALSNFVTWKKEGLDSAEYVIKNSTSEEIVIDNNGINCKSMNDIGYYGDHQCRLTGNGLYLTNNAWKSVRSAIGLIKFNEVWMYGILADCIIGDFIVGKNVNVSNNNGSVEITGDGIKIGGGSLYIANNNYSVEIDPNKEDNNTKSGYLFCVKKKSDDSVIMGVDNSGNGYFKGIIYATNGEFSGNIVGSTINSSDIISTNINGGVITSGTNSQFTKIIDGTIQNYGFNDGKERKAWLSNGVIELNSVANGNENLYLTSEKILLSNIFSATESGISLMRNTTVEGFELVKSLNSHKVYLGWENSSLQLKVDITDIGKVLTLNDNSSWTEDGNYRTGSSINKRNLTSVEYVQVKFNQLKDEINELKQKIK